MAPKTKISVANCLMVTGLLPYLAVLIFVALTSGRTGDAGLAAGLTMMLGFVIAYVVAMVVAFPAFLWSCALAKSLDSDTRYSIVLRRLVVCVVSSVFLVFAFCAFVPFLN
ncbi:MAG: hypothetical protein ABWY02_06865 [Telluria sp.]